ncbi:lantibiotic dehydratase C-terminal domain-containing protein [Paenibacillus kobensis]|uniref:lantibiotic dehydratase C-terminal domain-containing protein n=1 Tax=Paenibacillus kobensis TaxID=59841 RepID=UPI000FD71BE1|nr:lantibiotic dehydratase C-terminal domain-containing protein [Paenibacillus kobensis]
MMNGRHNGWRALHLFCRGSKIQEHLLLEKLLLNVMRMHEKGEVLGWFYSRYSGGGAHLRLRLFRPTEFAMKKLRAAAERMLRSMPVSSGEEEELTGAKVSPFILHETSVALDYDFTPMVEFDYEPEFARYGGVAAMPISERLFQRSSETSAIIISRSVDSRSKRMVPALCMMIVTASRFGVKKDELSSFFAAYADYWSVFLNARDVKLQYDQQAIEEAETLSNRLSMPALVGEETPQDDVIAVWSHMVSDASMKLEDLALAGKLLVPYTGQPAIQEADRLEAFRSIAWSHIHMMNNRLGMTPSYEYYLARVAQRLCEAFEVTIDN